MPTTKKEKLEKLNPAIAEIFGNIASGTSFKFDAIADKYKLNWSSGARSVFGILNKKLKLVVHLGVGVYGWTEYFSVKYGELTVEKAIADITENVYKQIERWKSTPRPKIDKIIDASYVPIQLIELDEMEIVGAKQFIKTALAGALSPALRLVGESLLSKLNEKPII